MLRKSLLAAACASLLTAGVLAQAGADATLLLRSGERVSGRLTDMAGTELRIWVRGRETRIPVRDVLVIDFAGNAEVLPDAEVNSVRDGDHMLALRDGRTVQGSVQDVGPSELQIRMLTNLGEREFSSSQVDRIYLGRPWGAIGTSGTGGLGPQGPRPPGSIPIPANQNWTPTGMTVRQGDSLYFSATGDIQLSNDLNDLAGPAGSRTGRYASAAPIPHALAGALIYRINDSQSYPLGDQTQIRAPEAGQLYIGINDDYVADNLGQFYVTIRR